MLADLCHPHIVEQLYVEDNVQDWKTGVWICKLSKSKKNVIPVAIYLYV